jgi:two-component system sensor histidine kinase HydH
MPAMLIELEPVATRELAASAARTLAIGGAASLALMAAALLFWRLSLRAQRLREEVERDRRLAALGRMSAVMAHEMLNPLASMKGHAQLLAESLPAGGRERGKAERVVAEAVRLEELSRGLLTFVRSQRIERREADPAAILRQAAGAVGAGRIDLDLGGAPERWSLDPDRLQQALVNLLHNALQASGDGGRAEAAVTVEEGDLVYSVRDHGPGVSAADAERIFEPFYTTRVRGTGLGLAVTRQIVELHGGTIVARANPGGGAELRLSIPRR